MVHEIWPMGFHRTRLHFPGMILYRLGASWIYSATTSGFLSPWSPFHLPHRISQPFPLLWIQAVLLQALPGIHSKRRWLVFRQNPRGTLGYKQISKSYCLHYRCKRVKGEGFNPAPSLALSLHCLRPESQTLPEYAESFGYICSQD